MTCQGQNVDLRSKLIAHRKRALQELSISILHDLLSPLVHELRRRLSNVVGRFRLHVTVVLR